MSKVLLCFVFLLTLLSVVNVQAANNRPIISGTPNLMPLPDQPYSFQPEASDDDGDPLSFFIENKPHWAIFSEETGELSGQPTLNDRGRYASISIGVTDGTAVARLPRFTLTVVNHLPEISGSPEGTADIGTEYSFFPQASDSDGDTLLFSIKRKPGWAIFDESNGSLVGIPRRGDSGKLFENIEVSVDDGYGGKVSLPTFSILVNANNAPEIIGTPPTVASVGVAYNFVPEASDVDDDVLTFSIRNRPGWGSIDPSTGAFTGIPRRADGGKSFEDITISVDDGKGGRASLPPFAIQVNSNTAPVIEGEPPRDVLAGSLYQFIPTASDADGDSLTFLIEGKPEWMSFDESTGELQGIPGADDRGRTEAAIKIGVTDGTDTVFLGAFRLTVKNNAPELSGTPDTTAGVGDDYSFVPVASDFENDPLTFSIRRKPGWAIFNEETGALTGTIREEDIGRTFENVTILVDDGQGGRASLPPFSIQIEDNAAPIISGEPPKEILARRLYRFKPTASDADGDTLRFVIEGKPDWATFNERSGLLRGRPRPRDRGRTEAAIKIGVTDGILTSWLSAFRVTVKNNNPTLAGNPKRTVDIAEEYSFVPRAMDRDNDTLTFRVGNRPNWLQLDPTTGELRGSPSASDEGLNFDNITLSVIDGNGGRAELAPFSISVNNNDAPVIIGDPPTSVFAQASYSFVPEVTDSEGDSILFSIINKPDWMQFDEQTGELSGTPTSEQRGRYPGIRLGATDGKEETLTDVFIIDVLNNPPVISGTPDSTAMPGQRYDFTPEVSDIDGDDLRFVIRNKPSWAEFSTLTGRLHGIPRTRDENEIFSDIAITVIDSERERVALPEFDITVIERNRVPYISGIPEQIAPVAKLYEFEPRARDENTEAQLSFSIQNKPSWLSFNTESGLLSGTPTQSAEGIHENIIISVHDERGGSSSLEAFDITVDSTAMTRLQAYRLLTQATFGPTSSDLDEAMSMTPEAWVSAQLNASSAYDVNNDAHLSHLERVIEIAQMAEPQNDWFGIDGIFNKENPTTSVKDYHMATWLENALGHPTKLSHGQDQLRQRVAYALSQLLVVSEFAPPLHLRGEALADYYDMLARHAFGNYRELLGEMSRSPAMGIYLSHQGNRKTDVSAATLPDENFAREVIQLFTIGLYELNIDGSVNRDGNPNTYPDSGTNVVPTYTQTDVTEMSKVMTGWDLVANRNYGLSRGKQGDYTVPMEFTPEEHEDESQIIGGDGLVTIMGQTFALNSGDDGSGMDSALDVLFAHPNVAPFVSKHLIMRLVTSNPSSDYVARVASVFNDNGLGVKGDLKAVVEAILLDVEAREGLADIGGKAREPLIAMTHFLRANHVRPLDGWTSRDEETKVNGVYWYRKPQEDLGQAALRSPSVFNFYDSDFVPSDDFFADNRIVAPEFQIQTDKMLVDFHNQIAKVLETTEFNQITRVDGLTLEEFVGDKDYFFGQALLLIDFTEELILFEQSLEGDQNGDFSRIQLINPETGVPYKEKAVDDLLDHLNQVLLGGRMTDEYHAGLKHYLLDGAGTKNSDQFTEALSTIRDAVRFIVTSSAFMINE